jgi:FkbM family methyltransferase
MITLERISQHSFLPGLLQTDPKILDLGANRGAFSKGLRDRYGWRSSSVEPTPELAAYLAMQNFDVIEAAVAGEDGRTRFTYDPDAEMTGSILGEGVVGEFMESAREIEVVTVSLDSLVAGRKVDLVKVDIEGAELDMFLKASDETLLSVGQFTIEFHDYWYPELSKGTRKVKQRLQGLGFWMIRGTPNNKDVLFVHPKLKPPISVRLYLYWLKNLNGLGRAFLILWRRFRPAVHF